MKKHTLAEQQAARILQDYNITSYPVKLMHIAIKEKIELKYFPDSGDYDDLKLSGKIEKKKNGATTIWVNKFQSKGRQRFALAHELGHFYFDMPKAGGELEDYRFYRSNETNPVEVRANQFATCLLMPAKFIETAITDLEINKYCMDAYRDVIELAKTFEVPLPVMWFRLIDLNYDLYITTPKKNIDL